MLESVCWYAATLDYNQFPDCQMSTAATQQKTTNTHRDTLTHSGTARLPAHVAFIWWCCIALPPSLFRSKPRLIAKFVDKQTNCERGFSRRLPAGRAFSQLLLWCTTVRQMAWEEEQEESCWAVFKTCTCSSGNELNSGNDDDDDDGSECNLILLST